MKNAFTVHCIPWAACASLLQEVRVAASEVRVINHAAALADDYDRQSRHAIAVSHSGQTIGCARLLPDGRIERVAVLPHVHGAEIKDAMIKVLKDYSQKYSTK